MTIPFLKEGHHIWIILLTLTMITNLWVWFSIIVYILYLSTPEWDI